MTSRRTPGVADGVAEVFWVGTLLLPVEIGCGLFVVAVLSRVSPQRSSACQTALSNTGRATVLPADAAPVLPLPSHPVTQWLKT